MANGNIHQNNIDKKIEISLLKKVKNDKLIMIVVIGINNNTNNNIYSLFRIILNNI